MLAGSPGTAAVSKPARMGPADASPLCPGAKHPKDTAMCPADLPVPGLCMCPWLPAGLVAPTLQLCSLLCGVSAGAAAAASISQPAPCSCAGQEEAIHR